MIVRNIKEEFIKVISNSNVLIIASVGIDSLCSVKIMTSLLSCENIMYALTVVESTEELIESIISNQNIYQRMLLINCGGNLDLTSTLPLDDEFIIFIIDNHLPYNLESIYSTSHIRLLINSNENLDSIPDYSLIYPDNKSHVLDSAVAEIRDGYNRFFLYGCACAMTMFDISSKLGKDAIEFVWYAVCGLTELFLLKRITNEKYNNDYQYLQQQVLRLESNLNDPSGSFNLKCEMGLHLYFFSHWTLMDSLVNSPLTSSFFQIWTINGKKRLQSFLADMGIPLMQAKNSFTSMDSDLRGSAKDLILDYSSKFGLNEISYSSFVAQFGYRCKITAADFVLTLISAIEIENSKGQSSRCNRFLEALDLLNTLNIIQVENQIRISQSMILSIAESVEQFIELHYIICAGPFLFGAVPEENNKNTFITNPLMLEMISHFGLLSHSNITKSKRVKVLPFIMTVPIYDSSNSVIIGIPPIASKDLVNDLHVYFKRAITISGISVVSHGFYPAYFVIKTTDRTLFFDSLVSVMKS